jgi:hypothetical protein
MITWQLAADCQLTDSIGLLTCVLISTTTTQAKSYQTTHTSCSHVPSFVTAIVIPVHYNLLRKVADDVMGQTFTLKILLEQVLKKLVVRHHICPIQ